jgi:hypothetical protein
MSKTFINASIIVAAITLGLAGSAGAYVWQFNPATGHYYTLTNTNVNWGPCEAEAVAAGGHLVTINDAAEGIWLRSNIGTDSYWIGFTDQAVEGTWVWIAGDGGYWSSGDPSSTSYVQWDGGEPNNMTPPVWGEDYAVTNWWSGSNWADYDSQRPEHYLFQGVIEVVPLPPSLLLLGSGLLGLAGWRRFRES